MPYSKESRSTKKVLPGIYQDGPERFLVRARWTDERGIRKKREAIAKTLEEAVALQKSLKREESPPRVTKERFNNFAQRWLTEESTTLEDSTLERYTVALAHACARFGAFYVSALTPRDIRSWLKSSLEEGYATPTTNSWLRVLRTVLDTAVEDKLIELNPARKVKALAEGRTKGKRGTSLTATQLRDFVCMTQEMVASSAISEDVGRMILVIAWSGLRRGEARGLMWHHWANEELHIEQAIWRRKKKGTKTEDPRRVAVVGPLVNVLNEQRRWLEAIKHPGRHTGLMFPASPRHAKASSTRRGVKEICWLRGASTLDTPIARIAKAAGVPPVCNHSFRRTYEDLLRRSGAEDMVRKSLAGWRSDGAQAIYMTVDPSERREAAQNFVDLVMRDGTPRRYARLNSEVSEKLST